MSVIEVVQRENIRSNLIIQHLAESKSNEPSERQAHDMKMLQLILKDLSISNYFMADLREEVKFLRRIGDRKEQ